jgi:Predicted flavoprotein
MGTEKLNLIGFGPSLRKESYNMKLLLESKRLLSDKANLEIVSLGNFPLYSEDYDEAMPDSVKIFKEKIKNSDGFVISSPEYDYSIPGYLKNAFDFSSRPPGTNPFVGKIGVIMSASTSMLGGARVQYHLRQVLAYLDTRVINRPEVFITFAHKKFDENGHLNDPAAVGFLLNC